MFGPIRPVISAMVNQPAHNFERDNKFLWLAYIQFIITNSVTKVIAYICTYLFELTLVMSWELTQWQLGSLTVTGRLPGLADQLIGPAFKMWLMFAVSRVHGFSITLSWLAGCQDWPPSVKAPPPKCDWCDTCRCGGLPLWSISAIDFTFKLISNIWWHVTLWRPVPLIIFPYLVMAYQCNKRLLRHGPHISRMPFWGQTLVKHYSLIQHWCRLWLAPDGTKAIPVGLKWCEVKWKSEILFSWVTTSALI